MAASLGAVAPSPVFAEGPGISIEVVSWKKLRDSARDLMIDHCREFSIPDLDAYLGSEAEIHQAELLGNVVLAEAFDGPDAIGYIGWGIGRHPGLAAQVAKLGPWYIAKPWRGTGLAMELFNASLRAIRFRGIQWALVTLPIRPPRQKPNPHFGIPFETTYLRNLGSN